MKKFVQRYKWWLLALILVVIGAAVRVAFPPHVYLSKETPEGNYTPIELFHEFTGDPTGTALRLSGKAIILEGRVAASGDGYLMLGQDMCVIKCEFRQSIYDRKSNILTGDSVIIKGVCRGMNLTEVLVTHCIIINKFSK